MTRDELLRLTDWGDYRTVEFKGDSGKIHQLSGIILEDLEYPDEYFFLKEENVRGEHVMGFYRAKDIY